MQDVVHVRCESCGMPLGPGMYGTDVDGTSSTEYCKFCFDKGVWVAPDMTKEQMISQSIEHMVSVVKMTPEEASRVANEVIPQLKRWKGTSH